MIHSPHLFLFTWYSRVLLATQVSRYARTVSPCLRAILVPLFIGPLWVLEPTPFREVFMRVSCNKRDQNEAGCIV